jgi:hypothetical protein
MDRTQSASQPSRTNVDAAEAIIAKQEAVELDLRQRQELEEKGCMLRKEAAVFNHPAQSVRRSSPIFYSLVARGKVVLAEFTSKSG